MNFRMDFSTLAKKSLRFLLRTALNLYIISGSIGILMILNLQIHEDGMFLLCPL